MTELVENTIDMVAINDTKGYTALVISNLDEWDDDNVKLMELQDKINFYQVYIQSGKLLEDHPESKGLDTHILLVTKYPPSDDGKQFLSAAAMQLALKGQILKWQIGDVSEISRATH